MTDNRIVFGRIAPAIPVADMVEALRFYTEVLGLEKTFENGSPVRFAPYGMRDFVVADPDGNRIDIGEAR